MFRFPRGIKKDCILIQFSQYGLLLLRLRLYFITQQICLMFRHFLKTQIKKKHSVQSSFGQVIEFQKVLHIF